MQVDSASSVMPLCLQGKFYSSAAFSTMASDPGSGLVYSMYSKEWIKARMSAFPVTLFHSGTLPHCNIKAWVNVPEGELG